MEFKEGRIVLGCLCVLAIILTGLLESNFEKKFDFTTFITEIQENVGMQEIQMKVVDEKEYIEKEMMTSLMAAVQLYSYIETANFIALLFVISSVVMTLIILIKRIVLSKKEILRLLIMFLGLNIFILIGLFMPKLMNLVGVYTALVITGFFTCECEERLLLSMILAKQNKNKKNFIN